jgi:hypothetical protein
MAQLACGGGRCHAPPKTKDGAQAATAGAAGFANRDEAQDVERGGERLSQAVEAAASQRRRPTPALPALLCSHFEQFFGCDFNREAQAVDPRPCEPAPPALLCVTHAWHTRAAAANHRSCHSPMNVNMIHMLHSCVRVPPSGMYLRSTTR